MLTVTEPATEFLAKAIEQGNVKGDVCLRLVAEGQSYGFKWDNKTNSDEAFDHGGRTVLVVDKGICEALADRTMDIKGQGQKRELTIR